MTNPDLAGALAPWIARARWFRGDDASDISVVSAADVTALLEGAPKPQDGAPEAAGTRALWLVVRGGDTEYNVPVILEPRAGARAARDAGADSGDEPVAELGGSSIFDATTHPAGQYLLHALATTAARLETEAGTLEGAPVRPAPRFSSARRLNSEQSNTSITYRSEAGEPIIIKLFRVLTEGANPDVELTTALSESGAVPRQYGSASLTRPGREAAHVLTAAEFLEGARDAWQVLTAELAHSDGTLGADAARIEDLGRLTRRIHEALARALPTREADDTDRRALRASWEARREEAERHAPEIATRRAQITAIFDAALGGPLPRLQRIHGDYHLGQVVDVPGRGWFALDFEGEPLRPMAERRRPDLALRDVAGMLRSFDYAGGQGARDGADEAAMRAWTKAASAAFLRGYDGIPAEFEPLLRALILDKALYEVSYEAASRPDWVSIPLGGLERLLEESVGQDDEAPAPAPEPNPAAEPSPESSSPDATQLSSNPQTAPTEGENMSNYYDVSPDVLDAVSNGWYYAPHDVLGPHVSDGHVTIRAIRRLADAVFIETPAGRVEATHEYNGIWRAVLDGEDVPDYRVVAVYNGVEDRSDDPYRFLPTLGEMDIYLFSEGRHEELWKVLGAHVKHYPSELGEVRGTAFSVWAPNAKAVRVVGDFNGWDGSLHAMRSLGESGIWEIFVPGVEEGAHYKFEIQYKDLSWHQKADPMARRTEVPPATASIVTSSDYEWGDEDWLDARQDVQDGPVSVYEMHLGSWRPGLSYREIADQLIGHIQYLGFTHVEFMPLTEHPFAPSWGYQVTGFYAPTSRYGSPDDLRYLIDRLHQAGIGVIMDWVPAHFATDPWALAKFDGEALYEDPNPRRGYQPDWGTYVFNYGRRQVKNFLVASALYWLEEFHLDGIRVDAVASMLYLDYSRKDGEWEPNVYGGRENLEAIAFIQETNATAYRRNPGILMIAEESTSWPGVTDTTDSGGLGFGLKWNMGWMNDTLRYLAEKPVNRSWHHGEITFSMVYAYSENFLLPLSHDEVVHGKGSLYERMPGDDWQKRAGVRELFAYQWAHPGKQLIFMGQEFAQVGEWNESAGLEWYRTNEPSHDGVMSLVRRLNQVYVAHPALWSDDFTPHGFEWIDGSDSNNNVLTFVRRSHSDDDEVVVAVNFSGIPHNDYRIGFPSAGEWDEIVNTDAVEYGGSGVGNLGAVTTEPVSWNGRADSALVQLPPFGVLYFAKKDGE